LSLCNAAAKWVHNYIPSIMQWHQQLIQKCIAYTGFGMHIAHNLITTTQILAPPEQIWLLAVYHYVDSCPKNFIKCTFAIQ